MNEDKATRSMADIDDQVSDRYASLADERTPAHLDAVVMREAKRAVHADNRKGSSGAWFRPVAFVTTAVLCFAIIIDLNYLGIFDAPDAIIESAPPVPDQASLDEIKRREKAAVSAARPAAGQSREPGQARAMKLEPAASTKRHSGTDSEPDLAAGGAACTEEQKSTAAAWWRCIQALRESGQTEAAELELEKLAENHPDFTPP